MQTTVWELHTNYLAVCQVPEMLTKLDPTAEMKLSEGVVQEIIPQICAHMPKLTWTLRGWTQTDNVPIALSTITLDALAASTFERAERQKYHHPLKCALQRGKKQYKAVKR